MRPPLREGGILLANSSYEGSLPVDVPELEKMVRVLPSRRRPLTQLEYPAIFSSKLAGRVPSYLIVDLLRLVVKEVCAPTLTSPQRLTSDAGRARESLSENCFLLRFMARGKGYLATIFFPNQARNGCPRCNPRRARRDFDPIPDIPSCDVKFE